MHRRIAGELVPYFAYEADLDTGKVTMTVYAGERLDLPLMEEPVVLEREMTDVERELAERALSGKDEGGTGIRAIHELHDLMEEWHGEWCADHAPAASLDEILSIGSRKRP
ncbi:hypothetical protein [Limnochorda pilosa]|uniref:Uncharacterized protein n=1 Tax=Limnochorda pilosa TaxID=1555112 RepID=A0A0K2SQV0_LIMPI|nr:hypothetical protein [Limnochorda pilosa]BAS29387.1 hypothetical protein LIP_3576 [Limnochorda pilosa]